jgi:hypothetical protein
MRSAGVIDDAQRGMKVSSHDVLCFRQVTIAVNR